MKKYPLVSYFVLLALLSAAVIGGAKALGPQGMMLVQAYMLTPAIAALLTRLFFYEAKFRDANLRLGKWRDYLRFWLASLGITALSYVLFTLLGSVSWDISGATFLERLAQQFVMGGQNIEDTLPPGITPQMMLWLFFAGGLTVFNILPGLITGFGEEFGHRGFMFPLLYRVDPWVGLLVGGTLWYAWHLPLSLVVPAGVHYPAWQLAANHLILLVGSICTFVYLAYVYVKSRSVFVTALAHITMNNAAASFSYLVTIENQILANLGLALTMLIVVVVLYVRDALRVFKVYFQDADHAV
jgi:membrane protease YdiL (CAAX protease family)